jgi:hypothetical protein
MKLKTTKHPKFANTYVVNAFNKEYHISHFLEEDGEFRGEWVITENNNGSFEWVDTVYGKAYALQRIQEIQDWEKAKTNSWRVK